MNQHPQTIQIYLPQGDPQGIRVAEITTRIVQVIDVPRSLLKQFYELQESNQVAFYFLIEKSADSKPTVYIGQTGNLRNRLKNHDQEKDFWERVLIVVSRTNNLTQTHALFLEWYCLRQAQQIDRSLLDNGNSGSKPHTPPPLEAECLEIFATAKTLISTLGFPIFEPLIEQQEARPENIFYCTSSEADGRGQYTSEGFVIMAGSSGRVQTRKIGKTYLELRERLIKNGDAKIEGDRFVFQKDQLFSSPSKAGTVLMGRASNGWIDWKGIDGRTMDEIIRQSDPIPDQEAT